MVKISRRAFHQNRYNPTRPPKEPNMAATVLGPRSFHYDLTGRDRDFANFKIFAMIHLGGLGS
jgi:hypothetical protein